MMMMAVFNAPLGKKTFLLAILLVVPTLAEATTYYVAKTGSDSHSCSQAQNQSTPKLTINAGTACLASGDTLVISRGTYNESLGYHAIPAGSSFASTTIKNNPGDIVILQPTNPTSVGDAVSFCCGDSYITLDGLTLDGKFVTYDVIRINDGSNHIIIQNAVIKATGGTNDLNGVFIQNTNSNDNQIVNNEIFDIAWTNQGHGIYVRGLRNLVSGNKIHHIAGHGVHIYDSGGGINNNVVRFNYVHDNGSRGILIGSGSGNVAYNNIVANNGAALNAEGIAIGFAGAAQNLVYSNTIYGSANACIIVRADATTSIVRNNICWQNSINTILDQNGTSIIDHNLFSDPLFIDASSGNFNLRSGSPAIGTGTANIGNGITLTPSGFAPDIGAYAPSGELRLPTSPVNLLARPK